MKLAIGETPILTYIGRMKKDDEQRIAAMMAKTIALFAAVPRHFGLVLYIWMQMRRSKLKERSQLWN